MVDKRKRAGSDAAFASHHGSDDDEHIAGDQPAAEEMVQLNKALVPFKDGAELHEALQTPSADLLRLLLSRLRHQTTLSFAEKHAKINHPRR